MDHTFYFKLSNDERGRSFWGSDTLDKSTQEYVALDCGNDLIDKFKAYYELIHNKEIPRPHLFVIDDSSVNAFAVYEKDLGEYCIGVYHGAFKRIRQKTEDIVDMVIEKSAHIPERERLILSNERDRWVDFVYINAMRFFIAHEYAHILNGHIDGNKVGHFEFADETLSADENLFKQMKEFDADETAMSMLCFMTRSSFESEYRRREAMINEALHNNNERLQQAGFPEVLINMEAQRYIDGLRQAHDKKVADVRQHLKYLMLGINVVFLVLDERRARNLNSIADKQGIAAEDRKRFFYTSGLQLIRFFDHPIPPLRLDAVIRIMDEYIEDIEGIENANDICNEIAAYVWEVEYLRCDLHMNELYIHIAHTPTAQDFMQEIEELWQIEKTKFKPYILQLERLFYTNRIVDMDDNGVLYLNQDS